MKTTFSKLALAAIFTLALAFIFSCSDVQSIDNRIVGTWQSEDGKETYIFNANGTGKYSDENYGQSKDFKYVLSPIQIKFSERICEYSSCSYGFSPDGKTLVLDDAWLTKK